MDRSIDIYAKKEYNYEYEEGKIIRAAESDITLNGEFVVGRALVNTVRYYYDAEGQLTKKVITPAGKASFAYTYTNTDTGTTVQFTAGDRTVTSQSNTDHFGRKTFDELQLGVGSVSRQFSYLAGEVTQEHLTNGKQKSNATTQLVSKITLSNGRTISYEYDEEERITKVIDSTEGTTVYTYDALGQLLTETKNGVVVNTMTYDNYGNIKTKNGKAYTYNSTWKDLLTSYNGQSITYDAQGNPTTYLGHTLTWEKGRQLKSFDSNTYTYNANGIRTSKTVNGVTHIYTLDGTKILRETWDGNTLVPLYDNEDTVCGILYNNIPYYFIKNLQGDVIAIVDKDAQIVARYSYDAWGVCTVTLDSVGIAAINPFRYRSYYYDEEIALYYLQSRYYDASIGRFVNGDNAQAILSEGLSCTGYNIFAYCQNTPINGSDIDGQAFVQIFAKIILGIILGVYSQLVFDILDYLVNLISDSNAKFSASVRDYILSILSCILAFFDIRNRFARILIGGLQIALSYVGCNFNKQTWTNLITDVMFLIVSEIIGGVLDRNKTKKIEKAIKKINKNKKKLSSFLRASKIKKKTVNIEQKFHALGVGITFSLNISNKIINSISSLFIN